MTLAKGVIPMTRTPAATTRPPRHDPALPARTGPSSRSAWRIVNITPTERLGRVAIGLAAVIAGAILLASAGSALAIVLEALLLAAGLDLAVTGMLGHCPLYAKLGHMPQSLRERL